MSSGFQRSPSRREFLKIGMASTGLFLTIGMSRDGYAQLAASSPTELILPEGFQYDVVLRWGDPLFVDGPEFDGFSQGPQKQAVQFGFNPDYLAFLPLVGQANDRGLLIVNHEYTKPKLMFPEFVDNDTPRPKWMVETEWAARGISIIEIFQSSDGRKVYDKSSPFNRRVTATTPIQISGPAAGHSWMQTSSDPTGRNTKGTLGNCGGGVTPWGTILSCEENFEFEFGGDVELVTDQTIRAIHRRYRSPNRPAWKVYDERFNIEKEPHELFRFGWVVEINPFDPRSVPVKRTALGRLKHEFSVVVVDKQQHIVVYTNDDELGGCLYKFVSKRRMDSTDPLKTTNILDDGTLYVARFHDDGKGEWLPLQFGDYPLVASNGFHSQAEVLINARGAADYLGGTALDRPEGLAVDQSHRKIYTVMTGHDAQSGHILEISEQDDDYGALRFSWYPLIGTRTLSAFDPKIQSLTDQEKPSLVKPDNVLADEKGSLWVGTDGKTKLLGVPDGLYVVGLQGDQRGKQKQFLSCPIGAEPAGMVFTPDRRTLFLSIQHPGDLKDATFKKPATRWPDFKSTQPPRPSIIAISKIDGSQINGKEFLDG